MGGKLVLHDNPLGAMSNAPTFDWHLTNLRNYIALSPLNMPPIKIGGKVFKQLGQGSGMLGLPGDFSPPSRLVRAAVFSATALPAPNAAVGIKQVFHILNNFDIPRGVACGHEQGKMVADYTMFTVARDPQALRFYYKDWDDMSIRVVDLKKCDLNAKRVKLLGTKGAQTYQDMTGKLK